MLGNTGNTVVTARARRGAVLLILLLWFMSVVPVGAAGSPNAAQAPSPRAPAAPNPPPDWTGESNQGVAFYGWSVRLAGDVNGDGYADVIVGAPSYDNGQMDEGRAFVYHGSASGLSTVANWTAESDLAITFFGRSVSAAGDVNGDGYDDVIVGADYYANGQTNEGRAFVYHGSASGLSTVANWTAESDQVNAYFGTSVSTAGDVNSDGYDDVIVGAYLYDNGQSQEGRAYVYHGSASGLSAVADWTAEGDLASAFFGWSVSAAGDVNADGYDDVIVGAYFYGNGQTAEGAAYVYLGSLTGLSTTANWTAESDQAFAYFGFAVSAAGDVNNDGYGDVLVGAYKYDNGQTDEGRAYVYHGSAAGLSTTANWTAESDQVNTTFGYSVSTAGDVNGDGYADVLVGAYLYTMGQDGEGKAFVYHGSASGLNTVADWTAEGNQELAYFGYSVSTAGDVNGDGYDDVMVGAREYDNPDFDEGTAYVYHGSAAFVVFDDTTYALAYDGWAGVTDRLASGGGYRAASAAGQYIRFRNSLPATTLALLTYRGPDQGMAEVWIDGVSQGTYDLYASAPEYQYRVAFPSLPSGRHTLVVAALGQQNPASTGTEVRVDAFVVDGVITEDNDLAVRYNSWRSRVAADAYSGSLRATGQGGSSVSFAFSGTQFTWITARGPAFGLAEVWVDGALVSTVDLYNPTLEMQYPQVIGGLSDAPHTVEIRVLGTRNPAATGNTVVFDAYSVP